MEKSLGLKDGSDPPGRVTAKHFLTPLFIRNRMHLVAEAPLHLAATVSRTVGGTAVLDIKQRAMKNIHLPKQI